MMSRAIDDKELVERFRAGTLTRLEWSHRLHVRLAYLYLRESAYETALDRIRRGILALNEHFGARSSPDAGYHETVTCAWMRLVSDAMRSPDAGEWADSQAFLDAHPELAHKERIYDHYSREVLASVEARTGYVEPDVQPLPAAR